MHDLRLSDLTELAAASPEAAVTIYMPTHPIPTPPHMHESQICLKDLRRQAEEKLKELPNLTDSQVQKRIRQIDSLEEDLKFWESQNKGLLICATENSMQTYRLPIDVDSYVAVDNRFHIGVLYGLADRLQQFYVLLVSQHDPRLFVGDVYKLEPARITLPASSHPEYIKQTVTNTHRPGQWENSRPEYFGKDYPLVNIDDIQHFYRSIDRAICEDGDTSLPLILAGSEQDADAYRGLATYPRVVPGYVECDGSALDKPALHTSAEHHLYQALIYPEHKALMSRYTQYLGERNGKASADAASIAGAAAIGKIDTLLLGLIRLTADTVRDEMQDVPKLTLPSNAMDGIDRISAATAHDGGKVVLIEDRFMKQVASAVAAIFRY